MEVALVIAVALAATPILAFALSRGGLHLRARSYHRHEDRSPPTFVPPLAGIGAEGSPQDAAYVAANAALRPLHDAANKIQDSSVLYILNAAWLLFIAFTCAVASLTLFAHSDTARLASAAIDALAFALVFHNFRAATRARAHWIRARSRIELLRQWTVVGAPLLIAKPEGVLDAFEDERTAVEVLLPAVGRLHEAVALLGEQRLQTYSDSLRSQPKIDRDGALTYLRRRAVRQARWFAASRARLLESKEKRGEWLEILFGAAAVIALMRVGGAVFLGWDGNTVEHALELLVLLAIGASSCATAIYINQNGRTLTHRYEQQLRDMRCWFEANRALLESLIATDQPLESGTKDQFIEALLAFERMMLIELLDWIHATQSDAMELAPA